MGMLPINLTDKVAIVTGSGRGIGKMIPPSLAKAGAKVVVTSLTTAEIETAATKIREKGGHRPTRFR